MLIYVNVKKIRIQAELWDEFYIRKKYDKIQIYR